MQSGHSVGPYNLISKLGQGSFGMVWLAERRTQLATTRVALKFPHDDEVDLELIKQEAEVWVHASGHPNVLPIIEANIYDGRVVIVSEFAPDGSLEDRLKLNPRLPLGDAVEIILGVLSGLKHLHKRGIIHRDLKPANILFQGDTPRLADFGVSRMVKASGNSRTSAGTPMYMAPEAFDGERTVQTDLWSAGVLFYQMLAGRVPFDQREMTALMAAIVRDEPDKLNTTVPIEIRTVVERALKKDKAERYQHVSEMYSDLNAAPKFGAQDTFISDEAPTIRNVNALTVRLETPFPSTDPIRKKSKTPYILAGGALLAAVVGGGVLLAVLFAGGSVRPRTIDSGNSANSVATPEVPMTPIGPSMADIPGGTFIMGRKDGGQNERPEHRVNVEAFRMDKTEVTNDEYFAFVRESGYRPIPAHWVNDRPETDQGKMPVRYVSVDDANAFARWRSARDAATYRLPTEIEWEYAARNGAKNTLYPWGSGFESRCAVLDRERNQPDAVGTASCSNDWGVFDLIGNVFEWTDTRVKLYPGSRGIVLSDKADTRHMIRGGSALSKGTGEFGVTSTFRADLDAGIRDKELGFRLVAPSK